MARTQAADYQEKRIAIRHQAAKKFAEDGFDRTSMSSLAGACGISKALLYHYYNDKDELLYDVIAGHLEELCATVAEADREDLEPCARLLNLIEHLLEAYSDADNEHKVQINALKFLSEDKQETLRNMERDLVNRFSNAIKATNPKLAKPENRHVLKPVTMSLFGMLNWHYMWFNPGGPLSRADYAKMAMKIITDGAKNLA